MANEEISNSAGANSPPKWWGIVALVAIVATPAVASWVAIRFLGDSFYQPGSGVSRPLWIFQALLVALVVTAAFQYVVKKAQKSQALGGFSALLEAPTVGAIGATASSIPTAAPFIAAVSVAAVGAAALSVPVDSPTALAFEDPIASETQQADLGQVGGELEIPTNGGFRVVAGGEADTTTDGTETEEIDAETVAESEGIDGADGVDDDDGDSENQTGESAGPGTDTSVAGAAPATSGETTSTNPSSSAPGQTTASTTAPGRTTPSTSAPGQTTASTTAPGRTTPSTTAPGQTTASTTAPGRTTPSTTAPAPAPQAPATTAAPSTTVAPATTVTPTTSTAPPPDTAVAPVAPAPPAAAPEPTGSGFLLLNPAQVTSFAEGETEVERGASLLVEQGPVTVAETLYLSLAGTAENVDVANAPDATILAGEVVCSYFVHFDVTRGNRQTASIDFGSEILGHTDGSEQELRDTAEEFKLPGIVYAIVDGAGAGSGDRVWITGTTAHFNFKANANNRDDVRFFVAC